jgi:hypothetical protein
MTVHNNSASTVHNNTGCNIINNTECNNGLNSAFNNVDCFCNLTRENSCTEEDSNLNFSQSSTSNYTVQFCFVIRFIIPGSATITIFIRMPTIIIFLTNVCCFHYAFERIGCEILFLAKIRTLGTEEDSNLNFSQSSTSNYTVQFCFDLTYNQTKDDSRYFYLTYNQTQNCSLFDYNQYQSSNFSQKEYFTTDSFECIMKTTNIDILHYYSRIHYFYNMENTVYHNNHRTTPVCKNRKQNLRQTTHNFDNGLSLKLFH